MHLLLGQIGWLVANGILASGTFHGPHRVRPDGQSVAAKALPIPVASFDTSDRIDHLDEALWVLLHSETEDLQQDSPEFVAIEGR